MSNFVDFWQKSIDIFRDYSSSLSGAKCKAKYGEGFKIWTPKWMLQRLTIVLPQVKAKYLLNEIKKNRLFFVSIKRNY